MKHGLVRVTNAAVPTVRRPLTPAQFGDLADVPPELEWLANLTNPKTRRAYKIHVEEFIAFAGLRSIAEMRSITRAHVIAWRKDLENVSSRPPAFAASSRRSLPCSTISASTTPCPAIRSTASSGRWPTAMKARRRRSGTRRRGEGSRRPRRHAQRRPQSRHSCHPALSRHPPRGALRTSGARHSEPPGRGALPHQGQARQDPLRAGPCDGTAPD